MRTDLMLGHQNDGGLNNLLGPSNMDVETARGPELDDFGDRFGEGSQELCLRTDRSQTNSQQVEMAQLHGSIGNKYSPSPHGSSMYDDHGNEELKAGERIRVDKAEARMRRSLDHMLNDSHNSVERMYDTA